ncbi:MAG: 16S rRNA (guanine(966)-N(2))-methyltransferase RsmD [Cyanobacteria bacterium J06641_5]
MRIYGNRLLKTLPGLATRPTTARVREALFNMWRSRVPNCRWLDLCAGNGSMSAEALCRGAAKVVAIDNSGPACAIIQANWDKVARSEQSRTILRGDLRSRLPSLAGENFDCIYFDPPYNSGLYVEALEAIASHHLLAPSGELAVEHGPTLWQPPEAIESLQLVRVKSYGKSALAFYRPRSLAAPEGK